MIRAIAQPARSLPQGLGEASWAPSPTGLGNFSDSAVGAAVHFMAHAFLEL